MTEAELTKRRDRATREMLVIAATADGHRVYAPTNPQRIYIVRSGADRLTCTCPDFERHADDPVWQCKHVLAVSGRSERTNGASPGNGATHAIETGSRESVAPSPAQSAPTIGAELFLKRSVSPDGRIDSLSVGFTWPVDGISAAEIKERIEKSLMLQGAVVERFRKDNERSGGTKPPVGGSSQAASTRMVAIGGMDGKWGRRLFIAIERENRTLRFFGTAKQLADAIAGAGYPEPAKHVAEGVSLNLPCEVVTKPSADGRYENVERILPANGRAER